MLNEPEYEEESTNRSSSGEYSDNTSRETDTNTSQFIRNRAINSNSSVVAEQIFESHDDDIVHSTPIRY